MFAKSGLRIANRALQARNFSTSNRRMANRLRIGFVPEHFSTPLHFAQEHFGLDAELTPFPTGTGAMTASLKENTIDVAIGLTEGFVADLGKTAAKQEKSAYKLVGTYVDSPLCWAVSVGAKSPLNQVSELKGKRVGVSRIGSGSYVMSYVVADNHGWLSSSKSPFEVVPLGDFKALRDGVNEGDKADFFMWEHFTTKKFYDNGELKRIGEIYTPWASWLIVARDATDSRVKTMLEKINKGVQHFREQRSESIKHITDTMEYSKADADAWIDTVDFSPDVRGVDPVVIDNTISILRKAGALDEKAGDAEDMIAIKQSN